MFVVDKMVIEDKQNDVRDEDLTEVMLPDGTTKKLGPSSKDAYSVLEDLCLLANSEKPHFLKLDFLLKTFALELIESVLTNYHELFRKVCDWRRLWPSVAHVSLPVIAQRIPTSAAPSFVSTPTKSAIRSAHLPVDVEMHSRCVFTAQAIFHRARNRSRSLSNVTHQDRC